MTAAHPASTFDHMTKKQGGRMKRLMMIAVVCLVGCGDEPSKDGDVDMGTNVDAAQAKSDTGSPAEDAGTAYDLAPELNGCSPDGTCDGEATCKRSDYRKPYCSVCDSDLDCADGEWCINGQTCATKPRCESQFDCRFSGASLACSATYCLRCAYDSDCVSGTVCFDGMCIDENVVDEGCLTDAEQRCEGTCAFRNFDDGYPFGSVTCYD